MRVLLVGNGQAHHVGACFKRALEQCGHAYSFVDERHWLGGDSLFHKLAYRGLGRRPLGYWAFNRAVMSEARRFRPQVVLVVKGAHLRPGVLKTIRTETHAVLINFATDDPFNDRNATRDVSGGLGLFDIYATPRRSNIRDLQEAGCRNVVYTRFAYDPALHFHEQAAPGEEATRWRSDVAFAGGADDDRTPYFERMSQQRNVELHLYGGYWERNPRLRSNWRGFALGRDYRLALGGTKVAPCLVRRANRDGHVMRTFETPACGAFMLAERTDEHLELFEEGTEIACFGSPDEFVEKARYYLDHEDLRRRIAEAGQRRVREGRHTYVDRLIELLKMTDAA